MILQELGATLRHAPLTALPVLFIAGVATSFTPCIYPMIPITAGVLGGAGAAARSRRRTVVVTLLYVLGLATVYASLGLVAGLTGTLFGTISANRWVYFGFGNLLLLAALAMFDVIPVQAPARVVAWAACLGADSLPGAFLMGATSGLVAAPCGAPAFVTVLAWVASTQSAVWGFHLALCLFPRHDRSTGCRWPRLRNGRGIAEKWCLDVVDQAHRGGRDAGDGGVLLCEGGTGMVKRLILLVGAALSLGAVAPAAAQAPVVGNVAPVVSVMDLDGKPVRIGLTAGKQAAVVEFWATWCEICRALMPNMRAAQKTYGDRVDFYGVNVTVNERKERVQQYVTQNHPPFTTLYDDRGVATRAFGALATSYVVIVDKNGKIAYTGDGSDQNISAQLAKIVGK